MKKRRVVVLAALLLIFLGAYFFFGSNGPSKQAQTDNQDELSMFLHQVEQAQQAEEASKQEQENEKLEESPLVDDVPREEDAWGAENTQEDDKLKCKLSVRCDTALENKKNLSEDLVNLLPEDGVIFPEQEVVFYDGESVFNLLVREMKKYKIHLEFVQVPIYQSAYIEGIANLYEMDCGELSGWMYRVNGVFPGYGASGYLLKPNDVVEWVYTCDLGKDVGGEYAPGNGRYETNQ